MAATSSKVSPKAKKTTSRKAVISAERFNVALKTAVAEKKLKPESTLLQLLEAEEIATPIQLFASQHVRIKRIITTIREHFFADDVSPPSYYFGNELSSAASANNIKSMLGNMSLFAKEQLLVIYEGDKVKAAAADVISASLQLDRPAVVTLITAEAKNDKSPLLARLKGVGTTVSFQEFDPPTRKRWLQKEAVSHGAAGITEEAIEVLLANYGTDISELSREIVKLSLLVPSGEKIDVALVRMLTSRAPDAQSFDLVVQLAKRNAIGAAGVTQDLLDQGLHPLQLASFLSKAFRALIISDGASSQVPAPSDLTNPWFLKNLSRARGAFTEHELSQILTLLRGLDFQLKDSKLPDTLAMQMTVEKIALRRM